jgi:hypothetical protein
VFTRDNGGSIQGGTINVSGSLATASSTPIVEIGTANNFHISNTYCNRTGTVGAGCFYAHDVSEYHLDSVKVNGQSILQDGIDICGPASAVTINGTRGTSGDDFQAACIGGYLWGSDLLPDGTYGSIHGLTVTDAKGTSEQGEGGITLFTTGFPGAIYNTKVNGVVGDTLQEFPNGKNGFGNLFRCTTDNGYWLNSPYNGVFGLDITGLSGVSEFTPLAISCPTVANLQIGYVSGDQGTGGFAISQLMSFGAGTYPSVIQANLNMPASWLGNAPVQYAVGAISANTVNITQNQSTVNGAASIPLALNVGGATTSYGGVFAAQISQPTISIAATNGAATHLPDSTFYCVAVSGIPGTALSVHTGITGTSVGEQCVTTGVSGGKNTITVTIPNVLGINEYMLYMGTTSGGELGPCAGSPVVANPGSPTTTFTISSTCSGTPPFTNTTGGGLTVANPAAPVILAPFTGFVYGNGTSTATANQLSSVASHTAAYNVVSADFAFYRAVVISTGSGTINLVANTSQPANGQYINVLNYGSGTVTIATNGQLINGGSGSLVLAAGSATTPTSVQIWSDGTNYFSSSIAMNSLSNVVSHTASYNVVAADFTAYRTIYISTGSGTVTLVANTSQPSNGQYINVLNYGSGNVNIAPNGQLINGGSGSLVLAAGSATTPTSVQIWSDGANYFASATVGKAKQTLTSVYTNATGTASTIWSFGVAANTNYKIDCWGRYQAATGGAFRLGFTGPSSPTNFGYTFTPEVNLASNSPTYLDFEGGVATVYANNLNNIAVALAATDMSFHIEAELNNGATAGTLAIQGATISTNTLTVEPGATCTII